MKKKTLTDEVIDELTRTAKAMRKYRDRGDHTWEAKTHSAAHRASMDLTRKLAQWRNTSNWMGGV